MCTSICKTSITGFLPLTQQFINIHKYVCTHTCIHTQPHIHIHQTRTWQANIKLDFNGQSKTTIVHKVHVCFLYKVIIHVIVSIHCAKGSCGWKEEGMSATRTKEGGRERVRERRTRDKAREEEEKDLKNHSTDHFAVIGD